MIKKKIAAFLVTATLTFSGCSGKLPFVDVRKPNIVFILADDMGWMDTALTGSEYYETPNLQRLAKEGMFFTNSYSCPLCSPTRAAVLTGKYAHRLYLTTPGGHKPDNNAKFTPYVNAGKAWEQSLAAMSRTALPLEERIVAQDFKKAGYTTGIIGKAHLGKESKYEMKNRGFDWDMGVSNPGPPSYYTPYKMPKFESGAIAGEYITDRIAREACNFIEENKDKPFLLEFWQFAVHGPFEGKKEYIEYFKNKKDPRGLQSDCYIMAAMLKSMDDAVGKLLDKLEELRIADNTIVIFTSDNGGNVHSDVGGHPPTNNYPLRQGKGSVYEGGIRVPTIIKWPGKVKPGSVCSEVVSAIDFYPTMLEMAGINREPGQILDGLSLISLLKGKEKKLDRKGIVTHFMHYTPAAGTTPASVVHSGDWKLIINYDLCGGQKVKYELYNLKDNISETINLAEKYPDKVKEMEEFLNENLADTNAILPKSNSAYKPTAKLNEQYIKWFKKLEEFTEKVKDNPSVNEYPKITYDSPALQLANKLKGAVTLMEDSQYALVGYTNYMIDPKKPQAKTVVSNGVTYVPASFIVEVFSKSNSSDIISTQVIEGNTMVSLNEIEKNLGKKVFRDNSGLIIISNTGRPFDLKDETDLAHLQTIKSLFQSFKNAPNADWKGKPLASDSSDTDEDMDE